MFSESIVIDLVLKNIRQTENLSRTLKHIKSVGIQTNKQLARLREQTNKTFNSFNTSKPVAQLKRLKAETQKIIPVVTRQKTAFEYAFQRIRISIKKARFEMRRFLKESSFLNASAVDLARRGFVTALTGVSLLFPLTQTITTLNAYEKAFINTKRSVEATAKQFGIIKAEFKGIYGAKFEDLGVIGGEVGKMGVNWQDVGNVTGQIYKAAKAMDFNPLQAGQQLGEILNKTGLIKDAKKNTKSIVDAIVHLENELGGVRAEELINIWKRGAGLYTSLGYNVNQQAAMNAVLKQKYATPELSASAFKILYSRLAQFNYIKDGKSTTAYEAISGEGGIQKLFDIIEHAKNQMSPSKLRKIFGDEAMRVIINLGGDGRAKYNEALSLASNSQGAAQIEWEKYLEDIEPHWFQFIKKLRNLLATIGVALKGDFLKWIEKIGNVFSKLEKWVSENTDKVRAIAKAFTVIIGFVFTLAALTTGLAVLKFLFYGITVLKKAVIGIILFVKFVSTSLTAALASTGIGLLIIGIAIAVYNLIKHWDKVKYYFTVFKHKLILLKMQTELILAYIFDGIFKWVAASILRLLRTFNIKGILDSQIEGIRQWGKNFDGFEIERRKQEIKDYKTKKVEELSQLKKQLEKNTNELGIGNKLTKESNDIKTMESGRLERWEQSDFFRPENYSHNFNYKTA